VRLCAAAEADKEQGGGEDMKAKYGFLLFVVGFFIGLFAGLGWL
jgi:hypothetical protein